MSFDYLGNAITCDRDDTRRAVDDFVEGFLAYESRAERVLAAADADAGCCLINVYAGYLWMLLEAPDAAAYAGKYLEAAERAAPGVTRREQLNVALLRAWVDADMHSCLELCGQLGEGFPRDLAAVKLHQYFEFNRGNFPAMLRAALQALSVSHEVPYAHGMAAFAYEQCHLLDDAEAAARAALALRRKEPWAQHALAHVYLARGEIDAGARFLDGESESWIGLNSFMVTHLWWHAALFYLSQGRYQRALEVYDRHCWGIVKSYSQDQVGAVSLLARLDLAGVDVGARWQELAEHLAVRAHDTVLPFLSLQYLYGLAKAGRAEAETLLDTLRKHANTAAAYGREAWRDVALPTAEGVYAHARGAHASAWQHLAMAMPRLVEIGGSHAQRDLFAQIMQDAALRGGQLVAAQQLLELRRATDPDGVPVNTQLAAVYAQLELPVSARQARARAAATLSRFRN
jgi:tetratricopeptide (TPR) repeat protein